MAKENTTVRKLLRREIGLQEALTEIDKDIGGITRVMWSPGARRFKIFNHNPKNSVHLPAEGASNREYARLQDLAVLAYDLAERRYGQTAGEVHLGPTCSSKHHRQAFREYRDRLLQVA